MKSTHLCLAVFLVVPAVGLTGCVPSGPGNDPNNQSAQTIIIDNRDAGFSIISGNWGTADSTNGNGCYGPDFRYHLADKVNVGVARFTPNVAVGGVYTVYIYWSADSDRTTSQPVIIHHAQGNQAYKINLQLSGNQWYALGNYTFNAGTGGYVEFNTDTDSGYCNADAVRLVPVP